MASALNNLKRVDMPLNKETKPTNVLGPFRPYILENKTNAIFHPNIGSLKTSIEEEWNKIAWRIYFEGMQIISKACWYNNWKKMAAILSKFTVLCLFSYFVVYFFKFKLIFFYNRIMYYYTRIFLILLPNRVAR